MTDGGKTNRDELIEQIVREELELLKQLAEDD